MDEALQDISGQALAAWLKELTSAMPILLPSADNAPELEIRARQVGILYYAHKPADYCLVEAVVAKGLEGFPMRMKEISGGPPLDPSGRLGDE